MGATLATMLTITTYGTWLRGDARGWRDRHHQIHVEGDYKNPPPLEQYSRLFKYARSLMKRDPVTIDDAAIIDFVLLAVVDRLLQRNIPTRIACFDGVHLHVLTQCLKVNPKIEVGIAKQYATAQLKAHGLAVGLNLQLGEGIWAKRSHPTPIDGPEHYDRATDYIYKHIARGAAVWEHPELERQRELLTRFDFNPDNLLLD